MAKTLVPVLADEFFQPVELVDFFVSNLVDRRKTPEAVKLLSTCHPLGRFQHLKRVRNTGSGKDGCLQILLCPAERTMERCSCPVAETYTEKHTASKQDTRTTRDHLSAENGVALHKSDTSDSEKNQSFISCRDYCVGKRVLNLDGSAGDVLLSDSLTSCTRSHVSSDVLAAEKDAVPHNNGDVCEVIKCGRRTCEVTVESVLGCEVPEDVFGRPYKVKVPCRAPLTRHQYEEACLYWPVTFHEDKRIARLLAGKFFSEAEVKAIQCYLEKAKVMADTAQQKGQGSNGIVIVDPARDAVIAKGHSLITHNRLLHAAMVGVDLVARSQGGGMWNISDGDMYFRPGDSSSSETAEERAEAKNKEKSGPYLCTGYHAYMTVEPCPMCSMALLHSRVSRVFYSQPQSDGALGSRYKLHTIPSLNHHFEVFRWTGALHDNR